ncbi:MAG: 50S ribosomal protein L10 [Betaproteobacteria bacterium]|nr:50S ribosomal protein L10 [Betaproteobacteria bacterium]
MISRDQKEALVAEIKNSFDAAAAVLVAENGGLTASEMAALRRKIKAGGGRARVIKNTLARRAAAGGKYEALAEMLSGALIYGDAADPTAVAKVFYDTAKANEKFILRGGMLAEGAVLDAIAIARLAAIPARPQLLAALLGTMRAPVSAFVRTLNEVPARFVRTLAAVRDNKPGA